MPLHPLGIQLAQPPVAAIILGSGLGDFAEHLDGAQAIPFGEVPGMPAATVPGHRGRFVVGLIDGVPVIAMQGRVHLYEGWSAQQVVFGLHAMLDAGAQTLIVTNAAGGIRPDLRTGALMLIEDHMNLTGHNCLVGQHDPRRGPRFPDMGTAYAPALRELAQQVAQETNLALASGVYAGVLGPSYETPAEIRMLRTLGADAVGMSTVQEVIAARQRGIPCLGISCITNPAADAAEGPLRHEDVQAAAGERGQALERLLRMVVSRLPPPVATGG